MSEEKKKEAAPIPMQPTDRLILNRKERQEVKGQKGKASSSSSGSSSRKAGKSSGKTKK
jgi:hypothetical protein